MPGQPPALPPQVQSVLQKALSTQTFKSGGSKTFRDCIDVAMQLCPDDADVQAKLMEALNVFKGSSSSAAKNILQSLLPVTEESAAAAAAAKKADAEQAEEAKAPTTSNSGRPVRTAPKSYPR